MITSFDCLNIAAQCRIFDVYPLMMPQYTEICHWPSTLLDRIIQAWRLRSLASIIGLETNINNASGMYYPRRDYQFITGDHPSILK